MTYTHHTDRPENAARIARGAFVPVEPHHQYNAGATCDQLKPHSSDLGLLVVSGALRIETEGEEAGEHQLYFPAQFCLVKAGAKFKWTALVANTSFYQISLPSRSKPCQ